MNWYDPICFDMIPIKYRLGFDMHDIIIAFSDKYRIIYR